MMKYKILIITIVLCLLGITSILGWLLYLFCHNPFDDSKFTTLNWKNSPPVERAKMADDLIENHLTPGISHKQVINMLGEPAHNNNRNEFQYWIGSWSFTSRGYDDTFIFIQFDDNDKLLSTEINGY